tara:strand:+ start:1826 stop:3421 length:1596 start_codon:yes stop_codon:yes gene_type:complete
MIKEKLDLAQKELKIKNFKKAKKLFEEVISLNPNLPAVYNILGNIELNSGNITRSVELFQKAVKLNPNFSGALCNLGLAFKRLKNEKIAIENYLKAIDTDPKNYIAYFNLGNLYKEKNDLDNAEKFLAKAIDIMPKMLEAYNNLFELYDKSNQLDKLNNFLKNTKANLGDISLVKYFSGIYEYRKKNYLKAIDILESTELNYKDFNRNAIKSEILAHSYDSIEKYDIAYKYFIASNNIFKDVYGKEIDKNKYINHVKKRVNFFSKKKFKIQNFFKINKKISDPVFLIGFPRSGTTLLDSILRSHNSIEVLEEKPLVENFIKDLENKINNNFFKLENIDENFFFQMRNSYFNHRNKYTRFDRDKIYIDKLPLNIVHIAEIFSFFPNSKFILALRNPYDVVLSCFMQYFGANSAMLNFTSLKDTAKLYDLVMSLWLAYFEKLPIKVHIIKYEQIVQNFDKSISELLSFLELEWSENVKEFYKTAEKRGIINTPSYRQINQPLYKKSIGRWKNYKDEFSEVKNILDKWTQIFNY